jgi:hypothetical protein
MHRFGPLLTFFQSTQCRLFSRCETPVGIFQRDLAAMCRGYTTPKPVVRVLEALNKSGVKCDSFKSLIALVRRELKKQSVWQLIRNGGALEQIFEDITLLDSQQYVSPLLRGATKSATPAISPSASEAIPPLSLDAPSTDALQPTAAELDELLDLCGSVSRVAKVLAFFLLDESPPRNHFRSVSELNRAVALLLKNEPLGELGLASPTDFPRVRSLETEVEDYSRLEVDEVERAQ